MIKYVALLRGINVGGKNKISMSELKAAFERKGFLRVATYINSGNVIFESELDKTAVKKTCEELIESEFGLKINVLIISAPELIDAAAHAPAWWNNTEGAYSEAMFIIPPVTVSEFIKEFGEIISPDERVAHYGEVIFWTTPLATYNQASISKIMKNKKAYNAVTVRNANTTLKLAELMKG